MSKNNNIKRLENMKQGLKRTIYRTKYRSDATTQPKNKNDHNGPTRDSFNKYYYMPLVEVKDFDKLIDNNQFFDHPLKNKQEA